MLDLELSATPHSERAPTAGLPRLPLRDIVGWDVPNWSCALPYWQAWLDLGNPRDRRVLVLGEREGGISLWFAWLGFNVLCTDYGSLSPEVQRLHARHGVDRQVQYGLADIFDLPYAEAEFDVVSCKSVIGGLKLNPRDRATRTLVNQRKAITEVHRVLKSGGVYLGAENLTGTPLHMAMRGWRHGRNLGWRYLRRSEVRWLFEDFACCEQAAYGFLGSWWPERFGLRLLCACLDRGLSRLLPADWLYISFIRARKARMSPVSACQAR